MKKLTSVVLSILMVVSLFSCLFTGSVSATEENTSTEPTNLIVNGDFESYNSINNAHNNTAIPAIAGRSVVSLFPADKTNGQWYRSTGGISPSDAPDLDESYKRVTDSNVYPTYFGANNQIVSKPGDNTNHVLRAIQDLYTQVELKDNGEYDFTFDFKLPNANTELSYFDLFFVSPKLDEAGKSIQNKLRYPFSITSAELGDKTTAGIKPIQLVPSDAEDGDGYKYNRLRINFNKNNTEWQTVQVTIKTKDIEDINATPDSYGGYSSPVLLKIHYDSENPGYDLSTEENLDTNIKVPTKYRKKAIYFDDFVMNEVVDCVGDAEFYDVKGAPLPNEQAYTNITTTVGGETVNTIYAGNVVTATVTKYDTESGAYTFLGWYNKAGVKVSPNVAYTFTATPGETYTPRFSSINLLGSSGSFEGFNKDQHLCIETPTASEPNFPTSYKWGWGAGAGYWRSTWNVPNYDKNGNRNDQTASFGVKENPEFLAEDGKCNVKEGSVAEKTTHTGNKALYLDTSSVPSYLAIEGLEANTNYVLSFYWRHASSKDPLKALGIVSSVNLKNMGNALNYGDYDNTFVLYRDTSVKDIAAASTDWNKAELKFNSGAIKSGELEKLYLAVSGSSSSNVQIYIDDMTLVAMPKVDVKFVDTKGEDITNKCANEAKPTITNSTEKPGYLVANVNCEVGDYDFRGWYEDDECTKFVSLDKNFEFLNGKYSTLTAKVVSRNILSSTASFEDYNVDEKQYKVSYTDASKKPDYPSGNLWGSNANGGYYGATNEGETIYDKYGTAYTQSQGGSRNTNAITNAKVSTEQKHNGDKSLRIDFNWRAASLGIVVKKNTDYKLSYYWQTSANENMLTTVKTDQLKTAVVTTVNVGNQTIATATDGSGSTITGALANLLGAESPIALGTATSEARTTSGGEWERVDISFNSGNLEKVYLVVASSIDNSTALSGIWIDDLTCYAENLTGDDLGITNITEYKASNMRSGSDTVKQALRHKFEIEKTLIDGGNDLYGEVVEYGSIAVPTSYLNGTELDKNGKYNGKVPAIGTAYNKDKGTNIKFAENDTNITFTAALTGIGKNGNYATAYARSYTVRNYIIFRDRNTNKETVVYGAKTEASVFGIMAAILDKYNKNIENPDDQLKADYNTVKGILNSDGYVKTAFLELYQDYSDLLD